MASLLALEELTWSRPAPWASISDRDCGQPSLHVTHRRVPSWSWARGLGGEFPRDAPAPAPGCLIRSVCSEGGGIATEDRQSGRTAWGSLALSPDRWSHDNRACHIGRHHHWDIVLLEAEPSATYLRPQRG